MSNWLVFLIGSVMVFVSVSGGLYLRQRGILDWVCVVLGILVILAGAVITVWISQ